MLPDPVPVFIKSLEHFYVAIELAAETLKALDRKKSAAAEKIAGAPVIVLASQRWISQSHTPLE